MPNLKTSDLRIWLDDSLDDPESTRIPASEWTSIIASLLPSSSRSKVTLYLNGCNVSSEVLGGLLPALLEPLQQAQQVTLDLRKVAAGDSLQLGNHEMVQRAFLGVRNNLQQLRLESLDWLVGFPPCHEMPDLRKLSIDTGDSDEDVVTVTEATLQRVVGFINSAGRSLSELYVKMDSVYPQAPGQASLIQCDNLERLQLSGGAFPLLFPSVPTLPCQQATLHLQDFGRDLRLLAGSLRTKPYSLHLKKLYVMHDPDNDYEWEELAGSYRLLRQYALDSQVDLGLGLSYSNASMMIPGGVTGLLQEATVKSIWACLKDAAGELEQFQCYMPSKKFDGLAVDPQHGQLVLPKCRTIGIGIPLSRGASVEAFAALMPLLSAPATTLLSLQIMSDTWVVLEMLAKMLSTDSWQSLNCITGYYRAVSIHSANALEMSNWAFAKHAFVIKCAEREIDIGRFMFIT